MDMDLIRLLQSAFLSSVKEKISNRFISLVIPRLYFCPLPTEWPYLFVQIFRTLQALILNAKALSYETITNWSLTNCILVFKWES